MNTAEARSTDAVRVIIVQASHCKTLRIEPTALPHDAPTLPRVVLFFSPAGPPTAAESASRSTADEALSHDPSAWPDTDPVEPTAGASQPGL